jgi:hypothetical protein
VRRPFALLLWYNEARRPEEWSLRPIRKDMPVKCPVPSVLALLLLFPSAALAFDGPLQVRNQFPLYLGMDPPFFESAEVRDQVSLHLNHSSVFLVDKSTDWNIGMDLELTELEVRLKKKLGERTELGLELPFLRYSKGFLDRTLAFIHSNLHTGDYDRHTRPTNEFLYDVRYRGVPVIAPQGAEAGIGDTRLTMKQVVSEKGPLVSVLADLELPTGSAERGFGNGSIDASLAALVDFDLGPRYHGYGNLGFVMPGDLKGYQTIGLRNYAYGGAGIEAAWWERLHLIAQVVVQGSPYPLTGIRKLDWPGVLLTIGGRYRYEGSSLELSLTEDPDTAGAPDFIANLTYTVWY